MIVWRGQLSKNFKQLRSFSNSLISASKSKDQDDKKGEKKVTQQDDAANKLNQLLNLMIQEDKTPEKGIKLTQAVKKVKEKVDKKKAFGEKLERAAKDVAAHLQGDPDKTESELLGILLKRTETEPQQLKDVLSGIAVEKTVPEPSVSRAATVRDMLARQGAGGPDVYKGSVSGSFRKEKLRTRKVAVDVDLTKVQPSTYFSGMKPQPPSCELTTWDSCVERDLRLAVTQPPSNIYEQMIQWTDRGMFWKFPIDNEQGLEEEKKVSFDEHVFLEVHLEGWCPERGPIRHFMELVCVGLSKNHWLTVEEKKAHIQWYRDYFTEKKQLIKEVGAGDIKFEPEKQGELAQ